MAETKPVGIAYSDPALTTGWTINGTVVTATATELNTNAGVTAGTVTAGKAVVVDSNKDVASLRDVTVRQLVNTGSVGTAGTGSTAVEYGDGHTHVTVLTVNTTLPAIAGGANLGIGKLVYTLPAGVQVIDAAYMTIAITQTQGNIDSDTPDVGIGTVIASGAVALLNGTATFENILTGQTATNCTGTATVAATVPTAGAGLIRLSGDAKTIYLNVADGWAASGDAAALLTGTITIAWRTLA